MSSLMARTQAGTTSNHYGLYEVGCKRVQWLFLNQMRRGDRSKSSKLASV